MASQTLSQTDISVWSKSSVALEPDGLVDEFLGRIIQDPISAIAFWDTALAKVPKELRGALSRLADSRLNWVTRTGLSNCPAGRVLLFGWWIEKLRRPRVPQGSFPTPRLAYFFYSGLFYQYGSTDAKEALRRGNVVLLALRNSSSTLANKGIGSYDDQIVVLKGSKQTARVFPACTEPGAQYSQRSSFSGKKLVDDRYDGVKHNQSDGVDINKDGIKDAGRLVEGTYKYFEKTGGFVGARAFQVKTTQVAERDTDGDGRFTQYDPSRIDSKGAGTSMYIHRGGVKDSSLGTWSAGCQTIPKNIYGDFLATVGMPSSFYYVLVNAE